MCDFPNKWLRIETIVSMFYMATLAKFVAPRRIIISGLQLDTVAGQSAFKLKLSVTFQRPSAGLSE